MTHINILRKINGLFVILAVVLFVDFYRILLFNY